MQHPVRPFLPGRRGALAAVVLGIAVAFVGCDAVAPVAPGAAPRPFEGVRFALHCPDRALADALAPIVAGWAARTGADVTLAPEPLTPTGAGDAGVIPAGALGEWAEPGLLAPVPAKVRTGEQYQWQGLLPVYAERAAEWGGQTLAVPLTGDGYVVVYRADRLAEKAVADEFRARHGRAPAAPATWEEFADLAAVLARVDKKPSLPPLPTAPGPLLDLFGRVAASADRPALNDVELTARAARDRDALAFRFSLVTGRPRATGPGFRFAAEWLDRLRAAHALPAPGPAGDDDPVAALADGRAALALLGLDQLARLPREGGAVPARFALTAVPGTRAAPNRPKEAAAQLNYVPYFSGGRLGVVRTRCPHPDAAFDLLAEIGGPVRSAELVATPGLGAGPTRNAHLDRDRLVIWFGYGFDADRSKLLQDALRQYAAPAVRNPTLGPRGPDRAALVAASAEPLRQLVGGAVPPAEALKRLDDAWGKVGSDVPPETLLQWRQREVGLH